ncbi:MAG: type I secretion system permease/ATPase [Hyphomicrobiaceae bacterium]
MLAAFLFTGVVNVLTLATPLFTLQVFETVVPSGSVETLVLLALMAAGAVFALMLIEIVRDRIMLRAATWLDHTLGQHLLENGLKSGTSADEMQSEIRSLGVLRGFLTGPLLLALFEAPWMPLFIVALLVLHPMLGLVALVAAALLLMAGILLSLMTGHLLEETQAASERADRWWRAVAGRGQVAGALGLAVGATEQWELYNRSHVAGAYSLGKRTGLIKAFSRCVRVVTQIAVYAVGAHLVIKSELSPGALVASAILLARALAPLEASVMAFRSAGQALRAYRRLKAHAMDARAIEIGGQVTGPEGHLCLTGVTYYHPGRKAPSLHDINLALAPGECLAIVGPNGAGKSSLAAVIAGAAQPHMGTADLDGVPVVRWQRGTSEPPIGYLPDDAPVIEGTVHENIARFREASLLSVVRSAMQVGTHDVLLGLPQGYDTEIGPNGSGLSLRERRAVALTRAAFGAPRLVVLDEPEIGLDGGSLRALVKVLADMKQAGIGLAIATQDQRLLALADRMVLLKDGRVQAFGTAAEVSRRLERSRPHVVPAAS